MVGRYKKNGFNKFLGLAPHPSKKQKTVETCREYEAKKRKKRAN
jgi:hypothetical protein